MTRQAPFSADRDPFPDPVSSSTFRRERIHVTGQVQGVGFRPFLYRRAKRLGVTGWVQNRGSEVELLVAGSVDRIDRFCREIREEAPPLARVKNLVREMEEGGLFPDFSILESAEGEVVTTPPADAAVCPLCLSEVFDPRSRRYRYPFTTCTDCGPRWTLVQSLPYDRARTSMRDFLPCPLCEREYQDSGDRRFHAETNACPACGPVLSLWDRSGLRVDCSDPIEMAVRILREGRILAIKGVGGFHLAVDATNPFAVDGLREKKERPDKPLALMASHAVSLGEILRLSPKDLELLESPARPIVLLEKGPEADRILPGIAPGLDRIGVLYPYTPLHYLLFHEWAGRPSGTDWVGRLPLPLLVMTSANRSGDPLVTDNKSAFDTLSRIADFFLCHNREILGRCDDSVVRADRETVRTIRRSRGWAPDALQVPESTGLTILAAGGGLKNTVCLLRRDQAVLSPHVGDLESRAARQGFEEMVGHLLGILNWTPEVVACDLHPDFHPSVWAQKFARSRGLPLVLVPHHHAHAASVMAEHGLMGEVLALTLDGMGLGPDGGLWGGELLRVSPRTLKRMGHLSTLPLPGGDRAVREPWRMAVAALFRMGKCELARSRYPGPATELLLESLEKGVNAPETSSAGRLFDAAAALLGLASRSSFEGQAAMRLEAEAGFEEDGTDSSHDGPPPLRSEQGLLILDCLPLLEQIVLSNDPASGSRLFHRALSDGLCRMVLEARHITGLSRVVLSGGCFQNARLSGRIRDRLERCGLTVYEPRLLPAGDGGLSLGQAFVARALSQ